MCLEKTSQVFKKGDRVKISKQAAFHDRIIQDTGSEIVTVLHGLEGPVFGGNYYFEETHYIVFGDHLTLVEEEKEVKTFKVGDKVKVVYEEGKHDEWFDSRFYEQIGRIKYISPMADLFPYGVEFEFGDTDDFSADDLEPVSLLKAGDLINYSIGKDYPIEVSARVVKVEVAPVVTLAYDIGEVTDQWTASLEDITSSEGFRIINEDAQESDEVETVVINGLVYDLAEVSNVYNLSNHLTA